VHAEVIQFFREASGITDFELRIANEDRRMEGQANLTKGWGFIGVKSGQDAFKFLALNGRIFQTQAVKIEVANQSQKESFNIKNKKRGGRKAGASRERSNGNEYRVDMPEGKSRHRPDCALLGGEARRK
jgi:hypothetical protein